MAAFLSFWMLIVKDVIEGSGCFRVGVANVDLA
jgi:hypothetical protein